MNRYKISKCPVCKKPGDDDFLVYGDDLCWIECRYCHAKSIKVATKTTAFKVWAQDKRRNDPEYLTYVYACVDNKDNIIATGTTVGELASAIGVKTKSIYETMSRAKRRNTRCKYIKIDLSDEVI